MLGTTFPMPNFWAVSDPQMKPADMINFLKNPALVRALLMLLAIPQPWPFSLASR
jgi:putative oxidoreductase